MQPLPHESLLQTLAELSVAFVGFSMLASVFRGRRGEEHLRFLDFRDVAEIGLIAAVGSLAPQLLQAFDFPAEAAWRGASGLLGALFTAGYVLAVRRRPVSVLTAIRTLPGLLYRRDCMHAFYYRAEHHERPTSVRSTMDLP
jgi:hypothetical protein